MIKTGRIKLLASEEDEIERRRTPGSKPSRSKSESIRTNSSAYQLFTLTPSVLEAASETRQSLSAPDLGGECNAHKNE